jgi:myosin heavy subunit
MIDPKNISTWPVVFIEKDDIETIRALSGFADWFIGSRFVPDNCFGFNEKALVVYARGDKETIADYCFGNVRRHNKSLMNEIEVVKRENNKLVESLQSLEIETERLRNYKLHLSPVVDKYNDLVRENVKLESVVVTVDDLRKKLATSEETVKETLAIKQALFDEVKRKNEIIEKLNNSAKGFGKQNDDFSKEIMLLRMMVENLQSGNACKASDDLKTANVKLVRENEHLKEKLLALQIINAKMAEEELKSRAPSTELEKEN